MKLVLLCIYITYVFTTVISRVIYSKLKKRRVSFQPSITLNDDIKPTEFVKQCKTILTLSKKDVEEVQGYNLNEIKPSHLEREINYKLSTSKFQTLKQNDADLNRTVKSSTLTFQRSGQKITLKRVHSTSHRDAGSFAQLIIRNEVENQSIEKGYEIEIEESTSQKEVPNEMKESSQSGLKDLATSGNSVEGYYVEFSGNIKHFLLTISPIDIESWTEQSVIKKIQNVIQSPLVILLTLTIPVVDDGAFMRGWCKILNAFHCIISPMIWIFFFQVSMISIGSTNFLLAYLVLIIGFLLGVTVWFTSKANKPPKYHTFYAFLGFLTSIVWIYEIANEIVNLLTVFGVVYLIPSTILGLSVLALANSLGDLVSNIVLARKGFPGIGYAACIGGPLFNLLVGIGLPFAIRTGKIGTIKVELKSETIVLVFTAMLITVMNLFALPLQKFHLRSVYGYILISLYVIFLLLVILFSTGVIFVEI